MKALLLIDLQNDFMPGGPLAVQEGFECIRVANLAQKYFKAVIATKDWHPINHKSFAPEHQKSPGEVIELSGLTQTLWPVHCVQHTVGSAFVDDLDQSQIQHVITKGEDINLDSYSAFFDNAHRHETGLRNYLGQRGIDEIYLLGLTTEYCVKYSALDAMTLGLKTNVILDGCRGIGLNQEDVPQAIGEMKNHGVKLLNLRQLEYEI